MDLQIVDPELRLQYGDLMFQLEVLQAQAHDIKQKIIASLNKPIVVKDVENGRSVDRRAETTEKNS